MIQFLLRRFVPNFSNTDSPCVRSAIGNLAGIVGIVCNLLLFLGKLIAGLLVHSVSILADAINNLSDASSSLMTVLGFQLSKRPADEDHPYGHARSEYLSGLAVAFLILFIGLELVKSSVGKILSPEPLDFSMMTLIILIVSILVKLWMALFYRKLGKSIHSTVLMATSSDSRNDVISTIAVLLGCLVEHFTSYHIDGYVGLAVAIFILVSGWDIAKETISPLLGKKADKTLVKNISDLILSHEKVLDIHDLLVHDYGPGQCFASVHVEISAKEAPFVGHDIIDDIERDALRELQVHLVIHYDPVVTDDPEADHIQEHIQDIIHTIDPRLSIHDFRVVRGAAKTKLVFDLAVPYCMEMSHTAMKCQIDEEIKKLGHDYNTVIDFDRK